LHILGVALQVVPELIANVIRVIRVIRRVERLWTAMSTTLEIEIIEDWQERHAIGADFA
jgi:hypothetical protein